MIYCLLHGCNALCREPSTAGAAAGLCSCYCTSHQPSRHFLQTLLSLFTLTRRLSLGWRNQNKPLVLFYLKSLKANNSLFLVEHFQKLSECHALGVTCGVSTQEPDLNGKIQRVREFMSSKVLIKTLSIFHTYTDLSNACYCAERVVFKHMKLFTDFHLLREQTVKILKWEPFLWMPLKKLL